MAVSGSLLPLLPSHVCRSNLYKFQFSPVQSTTTTTTNKIILQNRNVAFWPGPNARGWIRKMQPVVQTGDWRQKMAVDWSISSLDSETINSRLCRVCLHGTLKKRLTGWPEDDSRCKTKSWTEDGWHADQHIHAFQRWAEYLWHGFAAFLLYWL